MKAFGKWWVLFSIMLLVTAWCVRPVEDIDVQWHLKIGEWMLDNHKVVTSDFFSVSRWGEAWTSVPWFYEVALAWLVRHVGWVGPTVWQGLVGLAVTLEITLLIWIYRRRGTRWDWTWPALTIPAALITLEVMRVLEVRFLHRPEMATHTLLPAYVLILSLWRNPRHSRARGLIWCLPALQIAWVNMHGVFALGPIVVGAFAAGAWIEAISRFLLDKRTTIRAALEITAVGILVALACFVTPYGAKAALYPIHLFEVLTSPAFKYGISEAVPVSVMGLMRGNGWDRLLVAEGLLVVVGFLGRIVEGIARDANPAGWARKAWLALRNDLGVGYPLVCAGMAYVSLTAIRNIPLFGLVAAPLAVSGLEYLLAGVGLFFSRGSKAVPRLPPAWMARAGFAVLMFFLYRAVVSERYYEYFHRPTRFAIGQSDHSFPIAGFDFLGRQLPRMAPLAMYGDTKSADLFLNRFGPRWKTYIDGRHAEVYDASFFSDYGATLGLRGPFFQEAGKFGIGFVVFCPQDMFSGQASLAQDLYRHPGWSLIYLDDCAVIFAANVPSNAAIAAEYALPPVPADALAQEQVYREWLRRSGRAGYDLYEEANANLCTQRWAQAMINVFQLGGLWEPVRNRKAWRISQVAALLSDLGWTAVADSIYESVAQAQPIQAYVVEKAINHAVFCCTLSTEPALRALYLDRLRQRCERLRAYDSSHPTVQYGLAYVEAQSGQLQAAAARLEALRRKRSDAAILDLLAQSYADLGDLAEKGGDRQAYWIKAVQVWRDRLSRHPHGGRAYDAYIRLGDLFLRLKNPLLARANYVCALNEADIPLETTLRVRAFVKELEQQLFGTTYVPDAGSALPERQPFEAPVDR